MGMRQCVALDEFGPCECIAEMKDASITDTGAECPFNFAGTNCSTCSDRFRGEGCTDCRTGFQGDFCCPEFFSGVDCSDCASDFAALPDCNTCIKPFLAWPNCTDCIDSKLTGENCDECAEAFKIPPDCIETMPALCPLDPSAECQSASNCGTALPPATNCKACIPYHRSICSFGNCSTPPLLETSDTVRYFFEIGALFNNAVSFAGAVIASESAGGKKWTCEDVYAEQFDWTSSCHNALDTRGQNVIQASSQYSMTFARFASGQTSLFIVYAYSQLDSRGSPIGVSCGEKLVGAPGKGMTIVTGGTMLPLP
ncbi:MAG: hypothetical protein VYC39_15970 [Myxococcota bacterium]|nr:hypothetical protein [Myxococcota bacterium]